MAFAFAEAIVPYHTSAQKQKGSRHMQEVMRFAGNGSSRRLREDHNLRW